MNIVDIIIILPALVFIYLGYQKGMVKQFFSITSLLFSCYLAIVFYEYLIPFLDILGIESYLLISILAFLLSFILYMLLFNLLSKFLSNVLKKIGMSWADSFLGALVGFIKYIFFVLIIIGFYNYVIIGFFEKHNPQLEKSFLYPNLTILFDFLLDLIPDKQQIGEFT